MTIKQFSAKDKTCLINIFQSHPIGWDSASVHILLLLLSFHHIDPILSSSCMNYLQTKKRIVNKSLTYFHPYHLHSEISSGCHQLGHLILSSLGCKDHFFRGSDHIIEINGLWDQFWMQTWRDAYPQFWKFFSPSLFSLGRFYLLNNIDFRSLKTEHLKMPT